MRMSPKVLLPFGIAMLITLSPSCVFAAVSNNQYNWDTYPVIEYGGDTQGGDVLAVQMNLYGAGLGSTVGTVDGQYGAHTETAIEDYQRAQKLTVDGAVGPQTWDNMQGWLVPDPNNYLWYFNYNGNPLDQTSAFALTQDTQGIYHWWSDDFEPGPYQGKWSEMRPYGFTTTSTEPTNRIDSVMQPVGATISDYTGPTVYSKAVEELAPFKVITPSYIASGYNFQKQWLTSKDGLGQVFLKYVRSDDPTQQVYVSEIKNYSSSMAVLNPVKNELTQTTVDGTTVFILRANSSVPQVIFLKNGVFVDVMGNSSSSELERMTASMLQ